MNFKTSFYTLNAFIAAGSCLPIFAQSSQKPNILFLLADDLGYNELGCYGQKIIKTPNLDRLAGEGICFSDFHSGNAVSSPSRAVLMTGIYSGHNSIRGNQGRNIPNGNTRVALKPSEMTLAEMLKGDGYQTAFIGKWHLEDPCDLSTWAHYRGFDFAAQEQWGDKNCKDAYTLNMEYINGLQDSIFYDEKKWDCKDEFRTKIAFDYLDQKLDKNKPFFLFMSYRAPHAHEWYINNKELYADKGWPENERMHAAKITLLDRQIGRLIDKLESMKLMDNTLVIFTSDNGPQNEGHDYEFFNSNGDYRGFKRDLYEGGHRVPCIAYWKGKIKKGVVSDFVGSGQDFMATIADAVNIKTPKQCTGVSLLPLMTKNEKIKRESLYWEIYDSGFSRQAIRFGKWKAVRYGKDSKIQLYDLDNDKSETIDLSDQRKDIVNRLAPLFKSYHSENPYFPLSGDNRMRFITNKVRNESLFNNNWKFILGDNPSYRDSSYNDNKWRVVDLPHDWSVELDYDKDAPSGGNNGFFTEGLGWYRKTFKVDKSKKDKMFTLQFDGVFMNSEVWINGVFLGCRPYGYSTFQYDITSYLNFGGENTVAVRVDNSLPKATRWYNGSGIYRNVHLIETNYTHFYNYDGVYITTPVVEKERAVVNVDYKIMSNFITSADLDKYRKKKYDKTPTPHNCIVRSIVYDKDGYEISRTVENKVMNTYDKYVTLSQKVEVPQPKRWSDKNPYLYYMRSEIVYDNKVIDAKITRFGIRTIEYNKDKGLLVNGEVKKLKGVCLHHDAASLGAAVPSDVLIYRLKKLKEMGCNAIRTSHNPFAPEFYDICDSLGFFVKDECFDEWRDDWKYNPTENHRGKAQNGYQLYFDQWAETDLSDMIKRDRNHPSVIMYGIGNEIPFFKDVKAYEIAKKLVAVCHREDISRPVALGNNASEYTSKNGVDNYMDIMGYNYIMRQHPDSLYVPMRKLFPNQLFFGSETDKNIKYFLAMRDYDYVIGQFIWTGIDYLGETRKAPQRGWQKSLMDVTCNLRPDGLLFESCWSDTPKVKLAIASNKGTVNPFVFKHGIVHTPVKNTEVEYEYHRTWNWNKGEVTLVNIYSNCEEVALIVNGKKLARKKNDFSKYCTSFEIPYKEGKIEALGYNKGKVVSRDILETSGKPAVIKASSSTSTLVANNVNTAIIEVEICDKNGKLVNRATNNVSVEVSDNLKFIGMDTGNLFYEGNFKTPNRDATNGRLLIYVQSKKNVGKGTVTIKSKGLTTKVLNINTTAH